MGPSDSLAFVIILIKLCQLFPGGTHRQGKLLGFKEFSTVEGSPVIQPVLWLEVDWEADSVKQHGNIVKILCRICSQQFYLISCLILPFALLLHVVLAYYMQQYRNMIQIFLTRAPSQELIVCKTRMRRGERYQQQADVYTVISD